MRRYVRMVVLGMCLLVGFSLKLYGDLGEEEIVQIETKLNDILRIAITNNVAERKYFEELSKLDINTLLVLIKRGNIPFGDGYFYFHPCFTIYQKLFDEPEKIFLVEKEYPDMWNVNDDGLLIQMENFYDSKKTKMFFDKLLEVGKSSKKSGDVKNYYNIKRYFSYFVVSVYWPTVGEIRWEFFPSRLTDEYFWKYGKWAMYDNDTKTTAVVNTNDFGITLERGKPIRIFNGNGRSERLYFDNGRVRKLAGEARRKRLLGYKKERVEIELEDRYGWQEIRLPDWVYDNRVLLKIVEIYPGQKYQDICISEIDENWQFRPAGFDEGRKYIYEHLLPQLRLDE